MKSVFRLLPFLFLLGLSAYLPGVRAETCRANIGQTTVNIPNIKYLPTLPLSAIALVIWVLTGSVGKYLILGILTVVWPIFARQVSARTPGR